MIRNPSSMSPAHIWPVFLFFHVFLQPQASPYRRTQVSCWACMQHSVTLNTGEMTLRSSDLNGSSTRHSNILLPSYHLALDLGIVSVSFLRCSFNYNWSSIVTNFWENTFYYKTSDTKNDQKSTLKERTTSCCINCGMPHVYLN